MDGQYKNPESVLVVVYAHSGEMLLLRRADHENFWQSITGSLQGGESLLETAKRELQEETGLVADAGLTDWQLARQYEILPVWRHRYAPGVTRNLEHLFSFELPRPQDVMLNPREHTGYRWLPWQQAAEQATSWTNQKAIIKIAEQRLK